MKAGWFCLRSSISLDSGSIGSQVPCQLAFSHESGSCPVPFVGFYICQGPGRPPMGCSYFHISDHPHCYFHPIQLRNIPHPRCPHSLLKIYNISKNINPTPRHIFIVYVVFLHNQLHYKGHQEGILVCPHCLPLQELPKTPTTSGFTK